MSSRISSYKTLQNQFLHRAKGRQKERVQDLLNLYKDAKIFSKIRAQQEVNRYLGIRNETQRDLHFFQTMAKYLGIQPLADKRKEKRVIEDAKKMDTIIEKVERKTKARYTIKAILYSSTPRGNQKKWKHDNIVYHQVTARSFDVKAPKIFPIEIFKNHIINFKGNKLWNIALRILMTNDDFREMFDRGYIDVIYILDYDIIPTKGKKYELTEEQLMNQSKISMYHPYITTTINLPCETLREAIENKAHRINECWLNAILDNYSNTLLSQKKSNREKILNIINKTEDNIKNGISVNDMLPFFQHYSIPLRVYDCMGECIVRYDPEKRSHAFKAMYCLVKNDHIYVLNNVESLKQKAEKPITEKK